MASRESTRRSDEVVSTLVAPALAAAGFDLDGVSVTRAGARSVVRVVVDRDDGVDLDAVAVASRLVSAAMDQADPLPGGYVLEVTSPGVDRPLTLPRHWRRARGRLASLSGPQLRLTGRIVDSTEDGVELDLDGQRRHVPYDQISRAVVQVEFGAPRADA